VYLNTLDYFQAGKGSQPTRSAAGNFFKRSMEKTYFFWTKTYLIWKVVGGGGGGGRGEGTESLTKKIYPMLFLKYLGPLGGCH